MSTAASPASDPLIGTVLAERYRVERLLGAGGMGSVYLAEHILMKKPVAVKVLHREMTYLEEIVTRFEREAVAAGRIDHPNVAAATDFGRLGDGSLYLVLEYVAGKSLSKLLERGALTLEQSLSVGRQIAAALAAAHAAGIVHRDLKPDNVMLVEQPGGQYLVKVLDFGIAKVLSPDGVDTDKAITRIGTVMGTASYMSPEQAVGQDVDARSDLYSFGIILFEMLSGETPFRGEEITQILAKHLTETPPPLPDGTPPDLSMLVNRLLEKRPSDRIQTAAELVDLMDALRGVPSANPSVLSMRLHPASRRSLVDAEPASAASARSVSEQGATVLDADPLSLRTAPKRRGVIFALVGILGAAAAGFVAWNAGLSDTEMGQAATSIPSAVPPVAVTASAKVPREVAMPVQPSATVVPPETPPKAGSTETATSEKTSSVSETSTEKVGKTTVKKSATKTTSTKTTTTKKRSGTKRRTGPGGIYIPPPSEWF